MTKAFVFLILVLTLFSISEGKKRRKFSGIFTKRELRPIRKNSPVDKTNPYNGDADFEIVQHNPKGQITAPPSATTTQLYPINNNGDFTNDNMRNGYPNMGYGNPGGFGGSGQGQNFQNGNNMNPGYGNGNMNNMNMNQMNNMNMNQMNNMNMNFGYRNNMNNNQMNGGGYGMRNQNGMGMNQMNRYG